MPVNRTKAATRRSTPLVDRFWNRVEKTDSCWIWNGPTARSGYGQIRSEGGRNGVTLYTHRLSYEMHIGPIPAGQVVMHACDNRRCVNPAHLSLGSHTDNHADMERKRRHAFGERTGSSILTDADVRTMRALYAAGHSQAKLSDQFGIDRSQVSRIVRRERWQHVD